MAAATTTAREEGVLKLVHPGRHVEIHLEPISAAEVMKKNPRHSVTRPDIFEFPWVVVKPESILLPGKVFFIVPNMTIYKLNKEYEARKRSPQSSAPGVTTMHQNHNSQGLKKPMQALCLYQASSSVREQEHGSHGQNQGRGLRNPVQGSCWNPVTASPREQHLDKRVTTKHQNYSREQEHGGLGQSLSSRPSQSAKDLVLQRLKHQNQSQGLKNPVHASCWNPVTASPREQDLDKRVTTKHQNYSREQEHGGHGQSLSSRPSQSAKDLVLQRQKHQNQSQGLKNPVQASCWNPVTSSPRERDFDKRVKKQSQVGCWPETIAKDRNQSNHRTAMVGSGAHAHIRSSSSQGARNGEKSTALVVYADATSKPTMLKSCLRKHGSARKHAHRVVFVLPDEDLYQLKTIPETESL